jgi:hypothetical protein
MSKPFALMVFAVVCASVYLFGFVNAWTTFRYYPLLGQFTTQDLPRSAGPAMSWFAWIAQGVAAGVVASVVALVVPRKLAERVWSGLIWAIPAALIVYTFYFEWHWFQGR